MFTVRIRGREKMKILKNIWFSCKNWKNVAMIDGDGSWRWTMKSMRNQKVAKTNGETKNFEGRMSTKSEIVKKPL